MLAGASRSTFPQYLQLVSCSRKQNLKQVKALGLRLQERYLPLVGRPARAFQMAMPRFHTTLSARGEVCRTGDVITLLGVRGDH